MSTSHLTGREVVTIVVSVCLTLVGLAAIYKGVDAAILTAIVGGIAGAGGIMYQRRIGG